MRLVESVVLSLCFLSIQACADDLDPVSRVTELRLLAVQADTPFAPPGSTVKLTALAVDPDNRPLSWAWGTCIDARSSLALDCLRNVDFASLTVGDDLTTYTLTVPETEAPYVGVAVVACPGIIVAGGEDGLPLSCTDASGSALPFSDFEVGLKRIYTRESVLNQNPQIARLSFDGLPWDEGDVKRAACKIVKDETCEEYVEHALAVDAPDAAEQSVDRDGRAMREQAVVQYYASGGEFEDEARVFDSPQTKWKARREDAGQLLTFWFVLRDDRGGVSWTSRQLQVP